MPTQNVIIFGASGSIGKAIGHWFRANSFETIGVGRKKAIDNEMWLKWESGDDYNVFTGLNPNSINAVVWAQGANFSDNIFSFDLIKHRSMYDANVTYILQTLQALLQLNLLAPSARFCVISSIWQNLAKQNKLSYCTTKSALLGLVQSLTVDLGDSGYLINAVLPGALDTPMTRMNLDESQIRRLEQMTPLKSLSTLEDVCNLVGFLCSKNNVGITGQFITADRGFSNARII